MPDNLPVRRPTREITPREIPPPTPPMPVRTSWPTAMPVPSANPGPPPPPDRVVVPSPVQIGSITGQNVQVTICTGPVTITNRREQTTHVTLHEERQQHVTLRQDNISVRQEPQPVLMARLEPDLHPEPRGRSRSLDAHPLAAFALMALVVAAVLLLVDRLLAPPPVVIQVNGPREVAPRDESPRSFAEFYSRRDGRRTTRAADR